MGANVRAFQQEQNLTREELTEVLGYYRTYLVGVERGERNLTFHTLEELARRLEVERLSLIASHDVT
ncbi:MAG: helix-turn-helix domain-containing protein [Leucobacter sp.]